MSSSSQQLQHLLQSIAKDIQSGNSQLALSKYKGLSKQVQAHPNVQHFYALALKSTGQLERAKDILQELTQRYPKQAEFHNNLANIFKALTDSNKAIEHYSKALSLQSNYQDAFKNCLIILLEETRLVEADTLLNSHHDIFSNWPIYQKLKADLLVAKKQYEQAIVEYRLVLKTQPNYTEASIALASSLAKNNQFTEAISHLTALIEKVESPMAYYHLALCYFETHEHVLAKDCFEKAIAIRPNYRAAHQQYNEMLYQLADLQAFGKSYEAALLSLPNEHELRADYIDSLVSADFIEKSARAIDTGLSLAPENNRYLAQKARHFANAGKLTEALRLSKTAFASRSNLNNGIELVKLGLSLKNYALVTNTIEYLKSHYPNNQLVLAYEATCLKLCDRETYDNYHMFSSTVKTYTLPVPDGYDNLASFLSDLKDLLVSMHTTNKRPLQQTLKKGTQTPGRLLEREHPLLDKLKWAYETIIAQYIAELPDAKGELQAHPFLSRKSNEFEITGSWSVKLHDEGFHVNHVHPEGWISSACYISVPDNLSENEGCIRFGQSPLELGEADEPSLSITPRAGQLVLFPSYMWHGTLPYFSSQMRLTAPFDVVPK
ncbi:tetratricopeptide repeat protein [Glaciecola sp. MH2013]|uniref:putative 2OG-Fe(II) oxygenase n=1 Tax=Glaciecola sp. MH2013 TaxID=2785524 RepID=UPI00189E1C08|nr:putative 2OG-Fe(II) oxygenase [Glaciecola sp. MH2013]MBF7072435.1 tetratricopeptide repeat protein [Glaciecola sp. MH2013]